MTVAMVIYTLSHTFAQFLLAELVFAIGIALYSGADAALVVTGLDDGDQLFLDDTGAAGPRMGVLTSTRLSDLAMSGYIDNAFSRKCSEKDV